MRTVLFPMLWAMLLVTGAYLGVRTSVADVPVCAFSREGVSNKNSRVRKMGNVFSIGLKITPDLLISYTGKRVFYQLVVSSR